MKSIKNKNTMTILLVSFFNYAIFCQSCDIKDIIYKEVDFDLEQNSLLNDICKSIDYKEESFYNEGSFPLKMFLGSMSETFKTKSFDSIQRIKSINFDLKSLNDEKKIHL